MLWTKHSSCSTNVLVTSAYLSGSQVVYVNQTQNGGIWNYLGTRSFGVASGVMSRSQQEGSVLNYCADAVKFVYMPPGAPHLMKQGLAMRRAKRIFDIMVNQTVNLRCM